MATGVAVAGEVITDLVPAGEDGLFRAAPGGSPANVAVGLARLGVPTRLLARLSGDVLGRRLRAHLQRNGVGLDRAVSAAEPSSLAIVALGPDGSAEYDFRVDGAADWQWRDEELAGALGGMCALHLGSLGVTMPPGGAVLRRLAARARGQVTVSYDPNVRPLLMGERAQVRQVVEETVALSDVVKASAEDLAWLYPGRELTEVLQTWRGLGAAVVVGTLGAGGAVAAGSFGAVEVPGRAVTVADTVGAGDSFMSAFLAGLHRRGLLGAAARPSLQAADGPVVAGVLGEAVTASALTCARLGADPPTDAELHAALRAR